MLHNTFFFLKKSSWLESGDRSRGSVSNCDGMNDWMLRRKILE